MRHAHCLGGICSKLQDAQGEFDPGLGCSNTSGETFYPIYSRSMKAPQGAPRDNCENRRASLLLQLEDVCPQPVGMYLAKLRPPIRFEHGNGRDSCVFCSWMLLYVERSKAQAYTDLNILDLVGASTQKVYEFPGNPGH